LKRFGTVFLITDTDDEVWAMGHPRPSRTIFRRYNDCWCRKADRSGQSFAADRCVIVPHLPGRFSELGDESIRDPLRATNQKGPSEEY
jgi:hypothetical protein